MIECRTCQCCWIPSYSIGSSQTTLLNEYFVLLIWGNTFTFHLREIDNKHLLGKVLTITIEAHFKALEFLLRYSWTLTNDAHFKDECTTWGASFANPIPQFNTLILFIFILILLNYIHDLKLFVINLGSVCFNEKYFL